MSSKPGFSRQVLKAKPGETGQNWAKPSDPVVPGAETSWWQPHIAWVAKA